MTENAEPNECPDRGRVRLPDDPNEAARTLNDARAYMPRGWRVDRRAMGPVSRDGRAELWAVIAGPDCDGRTLHDYVRPRMAQWGLIVEPMPGQTFK